MVSTDVCEMSSLVRSPTEVANEVGISSIIRETTDEEEEKLVEVEKVEEDHDNVQENATAANKSHECRYLYLLIVMDI